MRFCFQRESRLLSSRQFRIVDRHGKEKIGRFMRIQVREVFRPDRKLGITVSRRFGKAVARNRFKRLVREGFRHAQHQLPDHIQINIRPLVGAQRATMQMIQQELIDLITGP